MEHYLNINEWNSEPSLDYWGSDACNMINGTDGTQFPPRTITEDTTLYIFVTQLCRFISYHESILNNDRYEKKLCLLNILLIYSLLIFYKFFHID